MGTVYLARDRKHGRRVAIKTIRGDLTGAGTQRFLREIQITAQLQHPHILALLDSGTAGDTLFYVMPYVEGESLRALIDRKGTLTVEETARIGGEVLSALSHAHARGVVHRDVKPDNVLLSDRHAVIADFGIAKALTPTEDQITAAGWQIGSPGYMAPEQLVGEVSPASDLYAVGAVLYEALTGRRWSSVTDKEDADWSDVPPKLRAVIMRALAAVPTERWASADEFRRALREGVDTARPARVIVAMTLLAVAVVASVWIILTPDGPGAEIGFEGIGRSIAVLPLENLNGDDETEYFSDGITEDIIAQLSRIAELDVISRNSTMHYKDSDRSLREIAEELNVVAVLDGSVRRDGNRVRIVSQLIDTRTDASLWSETYDRELTDVFAIQADVAQQIAGALRATVSPAERSMIERRPTEDVEAHQLYLRGRYLWNRRTRAGLESAVSYFGQAIERDSAYGLAHAGLADAYLLLGSYGYMAEVEAIGAAKAAAEQALALDPQLAEAWASHGQILRSERDWDGEEAAYLRAIELNPNYATAHQWYATLLAALGRPEEAVREIRRAEALDPASLAVSVATAVVLHVNGDYEAAIEQLRGTLELDPEYFSAVVWEMMTYSEMGRYEDALASSGRLMELRPDVPEFEIFIANVHAKGGEEALARETMERVRAVAEDETLSAWVHATLVEPDDVFALLDAEFADTSWSMFVLFRSLLFYMDAGPWFDPIRDDPRFAELIRRERLP